MAAKKTPHQIAFNDEGELRPEFKKKVEAWLTPIDRACVTPEGTKGFVNRRTRQTTTSVIAEHLTDPELRAAALDKGREIIERVQDASRRAADKIPEDPVTSFCRRLFGRRPESPSPTNEARPGYDPEGDE